MLTPKHLGLLGLPVVAGVLALILFIFFPSFPDPKCAALLAQPENDVTIPLPGNCIQTTEAPPDIMVKYLEHERNRRGLIFKKKNGIPITQCGAGRRNGQCRATGRRIILFTGIEGNQYNQ